MQSLQSRIERVPRVRMFGRVARVEGLKVEVGPTEPISLKGVQYAAKKYVTYTVNGVNREQGWIYAFSEPYQIFILYMILDKDGMGMKDRQDMKTILDSFELMSKK